MDFLRRSLQLVHYFHSTVQNAVLLNESGLASPPSSFLPYLRRTQMTLKARMQRAPADRNQYHVGLLRRGLLFS